MRGAIVFLSPTAVALALLPLSAAPQTPAVPPFEVVSIRPHENVPDRVQVGNKMAVGAGRRTTFSGPRATFQGASLSSLIVFAYDLKTYEGGDGWPKWFSDMFDISAKAEGNAELTPDQFRPLVQTLLAQRFKLKFHREAKEVSGYQLNVARGGPKFKPSDPNSGSTMSIRGTDYAEMNVVKWTMEQLVRQFSVQLREPVLDHTGLDGAYDFKLSWSDTNSAYATFFTAVQEQLGLKLDKYKGPVQMFIVDSAEKPSLD